jgi:cytidylate kinase
MSITLVGICGTNGSGKDALGFIMAEEFGFLFISVTDLLREECRQRNLPVERENLRMISTEWRREHGLGVLVDKAVEAYNNSDMKFEGLVMASLRNPGEVERLHELGGKQIWTDADPKIRYERIQNANRGRDEEDSKTFEEFLSEEQAEMHSQNGDKATLDMATVKDMSDVFVKNNYATMPEFQAAVTPQLKTALEL